MEYTVQKLARLAGVSARTLRHYHQIGLLEPARINSSGYRIYGPAEVDRLQQILFYREMDVELQGIREMLDSPGFSRRDALLAHRQRLQTEKERLEKLIINVEKTIAAAEGGGKMSDREKFDGFKEKMIADNEEKYGREIRDKYGDERVDSSNRKLRGMSAAEYVALENLAGEIKRTLAAALAEGDPGSPLAQKACQLHRQWLTAYWDGYSKEAHMDLAQMYVDDPRFTAYYDAETPGCAVFLRDAMRIYTR